MTYADLYGPNSIPQSEPLPGKAQIRNNAGGFVFTVDPWQRLSRFLILGSDSATYYQEAKELTRENAQVALDCWSTDAAKTANIIGEISSNGRASKQEPAIFALALGATHQDVAVRKAAFAAMPIVCRTASHLFLWMDTCRKLGRGHGRAFKRAVYQWYAKRDTNNLAYQAIKYRSRNGYTHKRAIEIMHHGAGDDVSRATLYRWVRGKEVKTQDLPELVQAHLEVIKTPDKKRIIELTEKHQLPWEALPTQSLKEPEIWQCMLPHMGMTALIRNLGRMTACRAIDAFDNVASKRLSDEQELWSSRIHPFSILQALAVYRRGHGKKGELRWSPIPRIIDSLDRAFYASFKNVEPTKKRLMLSLDVSGSMDSWLMSSPVSCREASAALALVTAATEEQTIINAFEQRLTELPISPRQRLDDIVKTISSIDFGRTDCALPMLYAAEKRIPVDAFVIYTDNETWVGDTHPILALLNYRQKMGIPAKCIVVGMTSTGFSIADPADGGMMDVVGFDASCPALISDFIAQGTA